jgi:hypothetical protein
VLPYITKFGDQHDVLIDVSMGAVLKAVRGMTFKELLDAPPEGKIAADIRRQVKPAGMEIESFTFTNMGNLRSIRLITHNPLILDN